MTILSPNTSARDELAALDQRILDTGGCSLAPDREHATTLVALADRAPAPVRPALADALATIVKAQLDAFPENIFWDLDAMTQSVLEQALETSDPDAHLRQSGQQIARLQSLFGRGTAIQFRYVHDFVYGFDWAKWVRRDPTTRAGVGPYDQAFLAYSEQRGRELLALIAADDSKYPKLPNGEPRNPFGFSREPEDELRLYRVLLDRDQIPVRAFETHPEPEWDRPFHALREELATSLEQR